MPFHPPRPLPPRGSTDWAAQQFYRVLEKEERVAAERERLRALGWRPPTGISQTLPTEPVTPRPFGDGRNAYVDLIDQDRAYREALDAEARRRVGNWLQGPADVPTTASSFELSPEWHGAGRFGVPVQRPPSARSKLPLIPISLTDRSVAPDLDASADEPNRIQVAALPAVLPLLAAAGLLGGYGAYEATRPKSDSGDLSDFSLDIAPRDMVPPEPYAPPNDFDPEEARRIQQEFGGPRADIPVIIDDAPESLPIQEEIFPNILTGPDISNPLRFPTWMESRRGDEPVRSLNTDIRREVEALSKERELPVGHIGGARDDDGIEIAEVYLKGPVAGRRAGGSYIDVAFMHKDTLRRLYIQTVDTLANGMTPDKRERLANIRVIRNMALGDIVVLIPKPRGGATLDLQALRDFVSPFLEELGNPKPLVDPRANKEPQELWKLFHRFVQ